MKDEDLSYIGKPEQVMFSGFAIARDPWNKSFPTSFGLRQINTTIIRDSSNHNRDFLICAFRFPHIRRSVEVQYKMDTDLEPLFDSGPGLIAKRKGGELVLLGILSFSDVYHDEHYTDYYIKDYYTKVSNGYFIT